MKYLILNEHKLFAKTILLLLLSFCIKLNAQNLTNTGIMYIGRGDIVSVSGDFANTGTTTFDSTGRFYLKGNWNNSGTFNANRSTIIFNGTNQQLLRGNTTFHNLTISKPTVIATLSSNVTVNDTLNFISGKIQTGSANLIIASGLTVSGAGQNTGWVYGNLQKSIASGSNVSRTFEIGRSNFYTPVEVNFASVITAGDVTAKVTSGDYPMLANATINASRSVNGYYSLSNSSTVFNTALVTFNWMSTDVGSGASSAKFTVGTYNGAGLIKDAIVSPESTSITATSVTAFGDFARGESLVPTLGAVGNFTLFTANGAVGNTGTSHVTGNVGTNIGAITGFGPSNLIGSIHVADSLTAQCATDLQAAYNQLFTAPATNASHAPAFGNNETLNAGVYSIYGAGSVAGNLTLDALGDTNAIFIFKFNGAFSTGAASTINLVNGVTSCNVFWLAEGAISMAASTNMRGTLIANNGAISMAAGGNLEGRMLSTSGAVSIYATAVSLPACASDTNTWTGALSTAWNDSGNWSEGIPSSCTDINIPSGLVNYPILNAGTGKVRNISLQAGSTVTVLNSTLQISGIAATTGGMLIADSGRIEFKGIVRQVVPAGLISSTSVKDLLISNANGIVLGGPIRVTRSVGFGNVNNSLLSSSGFLTLASTAHNTAFLSDITNGGVNTGNTVSGNVTVERYIPAKRAFRFLTPSVNTTTGIRANWMENTNNPSTSINNNPAPGFGTHISGSGGSIAGFDATNTNNPSLFTFSPDTQLWAGMTSTSALLYAAKGYRVLVRGDRSIDLNNNSPQPTPTILRATGTLVTGTVVIAKSGFGTAGMPPLAAVTNAYSFIGNPYASPVNWSAIMTTDISRTIYIFDPTISGSNERGAYVSYNGVLGVNSNSASQVNYHIQTGQSFFVQATGQNPSITFTEQAKTNIMRSVFRNPAQMPQVKIQLLLPRQLASGGAADGVSAFFDSTFSNEVSSEDSYKFTNQDENICIERNGKLLSIEGRKQVNLNDTLPIKMWQLTQPSYILKIKPENFDATVETWLEDKWLQTTARLYKDSVTMIPFNITADTASLTPYRFRIVFRVLSTLPVQLSSIKAYEQNMGVEVEWTALSENNMNRYEVERSAYTLEFNKIGSVAAKGNASMSSTYSFYDAAPLSGQNFYRIRSVDNAGIAKYSKVLKVELSKTVKEISVYPNPVKGNAINLLFKNIESGEYNIKLISHSGQVVFTEVVNHREGTSSHTIVLNKKIAAGTYILQVSYGGKTETIRVVIK